MPWYRTGTVSVTLNSNAVIGTGTSFIANSRVGDAFRGPDGGWYEVTNIASDTALSISPTYQGATVATGSYSLAPMQGYVKDSADALRAATQVIGQVGTDVSAQVAAAAASATAAKASEDSALISKNSATSSASTASSAVTTTLGYRNEAETFKNNAATSATTATTAKNNAQTSETNAAASATAAATSASQAATAVSGKANKGANSDITSLSGLTTPLSILQGGNGALIGERISDANAPLNNGRYLTEPTWTGSVFPGNDSRNQGFLTMDNYNSSIAVQTWTYLNTTLPRQIRFRFNGAWGAWGNINPTSTATWGSITGTLSAQTDLSSALNTKLTGSATQLPTAWVNFGGTGTVTLRAGFNASVTKVSAGVYRITFLTAMSNSTYAVTQAFSSDSTGVDSFSGAAMPRSMYIVESEKTTSSFIVRCGYNSSGGSVSVDFQSVNLIVIGGV
ncbi:hypothetical protein [Pseudomonas veronii]